MLGMGKLGSCCKAGAGPGGTGHCNLHLDKLNCYCRMMIVVNWRGEYLISRVVACLNVISLYLMVQETIENLVHIWNLNHITPMCSEL